MSLNQVDVISKLQQLVGNHLSDQSLSNTFIRELMTIVRETDRHWPVHAYT